MAQLEEIVIPRELQLFLTDITESKFGYELGAPWKYSEETLGVVVPILRQSAPDREYVTMYEVLKDLGMKDTGHIDQVELQNRAGKAVFVRAGTIFTGSTQNRAAQHSGIYQPGKEEIPVRCVHLSHGIAGGAEMKFGDIAPMSVTMNLMGGNQHSVWQSVRRYTSGSMDDIPGLGFDSCDRGVTWVNRETYYFSSSRSGGQSGGCRPQGFVRNRSLSQSSGDAAFVNSSTSDNAQRDTWFTQTAARVGSSMRGGSDDLLGHMQKMREGQAMLDDMMQKVPLFDHQVGAIIFNPVGVIAVETFDHPMSWEAIKKEIIEKYGDKIMDKQAEHLFELKPEAILPAVRKFIKGLEKMKEKTIRKDGFSETRTITGEGLIGECTIVKGQPVHVLLVRESGWGA